MPQAITNYLSLIGGGSVSEEIIPKDQLIKNTNFKAMATTGHIRYDLEKLRWINHKWISRLTLQELADHVYHYIKISYPGHDITLELLTHLLQPVQTDLVTLKDSIEALRYYFEKPKLTQDQLLEYKAMVYYKVFIELMQNPEHMQDLSTALNHYCKQNQLPVKEAYALTRLALTGKPQGPRIKDIIDTLGVTESIKRLQILVSSD